MIETELLTADEAASLLNVSRRTLLKWSRENRIERVKISRKVVLFKRTALDKFLQTRTDEVLSVNSDHRRAGRETTGSGTKKGGPGKSSRKSWPSLRKEVATWP